MKAIFNLNSDRMKLESDGTIGIEDAKRYILGASHEIAVHGERHVAPGEHIRVSDTKTENKEKENDREDLDR